MTSSTTSRPSSRRQTVAQMPTPEEVRQEKLRRACLKSLKRFIVAGWHILEPTTPFADNWHIDVLCLHLEAVACGIGTPEGIKRLLINIPPGHMKSLVVNVFWPAWVWLTRPDWRAVFFSYDSALGIRDSVKCRDLITSAWYQDLFKPEWRLKPDQNEKSYYFNTARGFRLFLTVAGASTGHRGDALIIDDPINAIDVLSEKERQKVITWWDQALGNRLNNMQHGAFVIIMQRLHVEDLAGHVLATAGDNHAEGGYDHVLLASLYDSRLAKGPTSIGWVDPRSTPGELLFPEMFPKCVLDTARQKLGSAGFAGQHQQTPVPTEGNTFKPWWWRYWIPKDRTDLLGQPVRVQRGDEWVTCPVRVLPYTLEELRALPVGEFFTDAAQSWDMAFKDTQTSSFVVGQVWASVLADHFLLDQVRDRWDLPASIKGVLALTARWPHIPGKLIEDKANGPATMQMLRGRVGGMLPVMPYGSKEARASGVTPLAESGNVFLPHPSLFAWADGLRTNLAAFPNGVKDEVDTLTQYLQRANANAARVSPNRGAAAVGPGDVLGPDGQFLPDDYDPY